MQNTVETLSQQAVKAALSKEWYKAIGLNEEILKEDPQNISALNRLGRAYAEIGDTASARKYFKATLRLDPINLTAQKNLTELGKFHKDIEETGLPAQASFVIEPATTLKVKIKFQKNFSSKDFYAGFTFNVSLDKNRQLVLKQNETLVALVDKNSAQTLTPLLSDTWKGKATLLSGKGKSGTVLLKSPTPIFKDKKQEIRPYTKHEHLEEIEMEIPEEE